MDGVTLKRVTEVQDLGVTLDSALQWKINANNIISKANRVRGLIKRTLGGMLICMQHLFHTVVL